MPSLFQLIKMGCFCSKESFEINGKNYQVKETLGEGYVDIVLFSVLSDQFKCFRGFSMVYLAQETNSRRFFAIKKIICYTSYDEKYAFSEVDIHNKVKHGNFLMKLVDYSSIPVSSPAKSHFYLVLPYFEVRSFFSA